MDSLIYDLLQRNAFVLVGWFLLCFALLCFKEIKGDIWVISSATTNRLLLCLTGFYGSGHILSYACHHGSHSSNPAVKFNHWTCKENWYL